MRIIFEDLTLEDFPAWAGGSETKNLIEGHGKQSEFEALIEELFPDGLTSQQLNDLLWFDWEWICEQLDISEDDE